MSDSYKILSTDYIQFIVGNAKHTKHYYQTQFGFEPVAYKGLETGDRKKTEYVLRQNKITIVLSTSITPKSPLNDE